MTTEIQWTWKFDEAGNVVSKGRTWNFLSGCDKVSPACRYCYAESLHTMRYDAKKAGAANLPPQYDKPFSQVQIHESRLDLPTRWRQPCRIFVNSMSDTFHDDVPITVLAEAWATMAIARDHTFLVLTKRSARARQVLSDPLFPKAVAAAIRRSYPKSKLGRSMAGELERDRDWPLPNVAIGASAENQEWANKRIPDLLATPANWRFLSCEPLLGELDISLWTGDLPEDEDGAPYPGGIDWVIDGGESGRQSRPTNPEHFRSLCDQCQKANPPIAYFHKQNGEWVSVSEVDGEGPHHVFMDGRAVRHVGKKKAGRLLDGVEWNQIPEGMN